MKNTTIQPLQVRKVSQLPNYTDECFDKEGNRKLRTDAGHEGEENILYENSYIMIAYPSNRLDISHNYKINLFDLIKLINRSIGERMKELETRINELLDMLLQHSADCGSSWNSGLPPEVLDYYLSTHELMKEIEEIAAPWNPEFEDILRIRTKWKQVDDMFNELS